MSNQHTTTDDARSGAGSSGPAALNDVSAGTLGLIDFFLLNVAYFAVNYWKRGTLELSPMYVKLLFAFYGIWFLVSLATGKFRGERYLYLITGVSVLARSALYLAYGVALLVVVLGLYTFSRTQILGTCLVLLALQLGVFGVFYVAAVRGRGDLEEKGRALPKGQGRVSWRLIAADAVLVGAAFFLINYVKRGGFTLQPEYEKLLLIMYGFWFACSAVTRKFERPKNGSFYHAWWPWLKSGVLLVFSLALAAFAFRIHFYSRTQVFGTAVLLIFLETALYAVYFLKRRKAPNEDIESTNGLAHALAQQELPADIDVERIRRDLLAPIRESLESRYLRDDPALFAFMDKAVDLSGILRAETVLRDGSDMIRRDRIDDYPARLFINLHRVNDIRRLNRYFLEVHRTLLPGGYLAGKAMTITTFHEWVFRKYPRYLAMAGYGLHFLIHRVWPKLPWVKQVYFSWTKGRGRMISKAELFGRLSFCGFRIAAEQEIDGELVFVARKRLTPSLNQNPSYGPLVTLNRTGRNGEPVPIYKFRTMHPYSEFLQEYIYEKYGLKEGGKLNGDFRVTSWGRVMRRLWLDELPMLYNWLRGDLQLFGVRPLSPHFFSLYPDDVKALRAQVKPGLLPPFYADMPATLEEICESERCYLLAYLERPIPTQCRYFCKAVWNILVKGARSQ